MGIVKAHEKDLPGPNDCMSSTTYLEVYRLNADINRNLSMAQYCDKNIENYLKQKEEYLSKARILELDRDRIIQNENKILFRKHSKWWAGQVATDAIINCSEHPPCPKCRVPMRKSYTDKVIYWEHGYDDRAIRRTFFWACEKCGYREEIPNDEQS